MGRIMNSMKRRIFRTIRKKTENKKIKKGNKYLSLTFDVLQKLVSKKKDFHTFNIEAHYNQEEINLTHFDLLSD